MTDALTTTPARYLTAAEDGHLGRDLEGAERHGLEAFFVGRQNPEVMVAEFRHGWNRAWAVAYAQGALASAAESQTDHGADNPYPQFSGPWEAWADGYNDHGCGALS